MRKDFNRQTQMDAIPISKIQLNFECRDEIIPLLAGLQHLYQNVAVRNQIVDLIKKDVNANSCSKSGRPGLSYWQVLVLAALRLGCGLNYDKLQDLAEQHNNVRMMLGVGLWEKRTFCWRTIRDNVSLLQVDTLKAINQAIVGLGHQLTPTAIEKVRADAYCIETNIHYPSESSLIADGIRVLIRNCLPWVKALEIAGWRKIKSLNQNIKNLAARIHQICATKGRNWKDRAEKKYIKLIKMSNRVMRKVSILLRTLDPQSRAMRLAIKEIKHFEALTLQVLDTAKRRILNGEKVPNSDKIFSIFETHTQLYKRGKAKAPIQFGRMILLYEDQAGFILNYYLLGREELEREIVVEQTKCVQRLYEGRIKEISYDRGFHKATIIKAIQEAIPEVCIPKPGSNKPKAEQTPKFKSMRKRHPGIESVIGSLQSGNRMSRCPDRTEAGFEQYVACGVLARNLQTLGKLIIQAQAPKSEAAKSKRAA